MAIPGDSKFNRTTSDVSKETERPGARDQPSSSRPFDGKKWFSGDVVRLQRNEGRQSEGKACGVPATE
jgi:hypothetical protein